MRKVFGRLAAVAAAVALTFVALPVAGASAGSNGQQLAFCWPWSRTDFTRVLVTGMNQDGKYSEFITDPWAEAVGAPICSWSDWWWKGEVNIYVAVWGGPWRFDHSCWVPETSSDDLFTC
jgi:hypothetical protein